MTILFRHSDLIVRTSLPWCPTPALGREFEAMATNQHAANRRPSYTVAYVLQGTSDA